MKKINILLLNIIFLAFHQAAYAQCNPNLRVGIIAALSGPGQSWEESVKNGFEMGLREAGCESLVRFYEDDQSDNKKTVAAYQKLKIEQKVNVVIVMSSGAGNVIAPLAMRDKIVFLPWATDNRISQGRPYIIRTWSDQKDEARPIAQKAKALGYKNIAAFLNIHPYPQSVYTEVKNFLPHSTFPFLRELTPDVIDFRSELTKLKSQKDLDSVFICLLQGSGVFARQMKELGITIPLFGCATMELEDNTANSQGALAGAWFATGGIQKGFPERAKKFTGHAPGTIAGFATHYELAHILSSTKESGGMELINELMASTHKAKALLDFPAVRQGGDQSFRAKMVLKRFSEDEVIEDYTEKRE